MKIQKKKHLLPVCEYQDHSSCILGKINSILMYFFRNKSPRGFFTYVSKYIYKYFSTSKHKTEDLSYFGVKLTACKYYTDRMTNSQFKDYDMRCYFFKKHNKG